MYASAISPIIKKNGKIKIAVYCRNLLVKDLSKTHPIPHHNDLFN